jgi:hypothetical protein
MIILPLQSCNVKQLGKIRSPKFGTTKIVISYLNIPMVWLAWFVRSKVVMVVIVSARSVVWNDTNHINILLTKKVKCTELNCRNVITTNFSHPSFVEKKCHKHMRNYNSRDAVALLGFYAVYNGSCLPTFRNSLSFLSSRIKQSQSFT